MHAPPLVTLSWFVSAGSSTHTHKTHAELTGRLDRETAFVAAGRSSIDVCRAVSFTLILYPISSHEPWSCCSSDVKGSAGAELSNRKCNMAPKPVPTSPTRRDNQRSDRYTPRSTKDTLIRSDWGIGSDGPPFAVRNYTLCLSLLSSYTLARMSLLSPQPRETSTSWWA